MHKIKFTLALCAAFLLLTGCAAKDDFADYSVTEYPPADYLSAETEFSEYDGTVETIWAFVTTDRDEDFYFDYWWMLEKEVDGEWKAIRFTKETRDFDCAARSTRSTASIQCDLKGNIKQPLLPGHYRLWVGGDDGRVPAEFTVK